jgi:formaldehyde-activating enzyme involved in methanogenesis
MDHLSRETLLHRILSGSLIVDIDNTIYVVKTPTRQIRYLATLVYKKAVQDNLFSDWLSREQAIQYLINTSLLPANYQEEIDKLNKAMDDTKVDMFRAFPNFGKIKQLKRSLTSQRSLLAGISTTLHSMDRFTIEGNAEIAKYQYMLSHSIYDLNDKKIEVEQKILERIVNSITEQTISLSDFRELARTDPWRSYWNADKENIYGTPSADWTDEQRTLVLFSRMYDNVYKHPECPSDIIIQDDDLLDGWQIHESRKQESEKNADKHAKDGEQFVMVNNAEDAKKVYNQNSPEAKAILKARMKALEQSGRLKEAELPDVKTNLAIQMNNLAKETIKGRGKR